MTRMTTRNALHALVALLLVPVVGLFLLLLLPVTVLLFAFVPILGIAALTVLFLLAGRGTEPPSRRAPVLVTSLHAG
jgi:hypothetical protein